MTTGVETFIELGVRLGRLEQKVDEVLRLLREGAAGKASGHGSQAEAVASDVLAGLTVKQHAVLQMLLNGKGNAAIAERLDVSENTAKVHVRLLAKKAKVEKRQAIVGFFKRAFEDMSDERYEALSRGLPKTWDAEWGSGSEKYDEILHRSSE